MALKTQISDLGSSVCVDLQNEKFVPALGNGASVPGDSVYIDPSNGRVAGADKTTAKFFQGFLMESIITGTETAIVADVPCKVVIPKSGHAYNIRVTIVAAADDEEGAGVTIEDDAGKGETTDVTLANAKFGRLATEARIGDTVAQIIFIE